MQIVAVRPLTSLSYSYPNNRITNSGWEFHADGRMSRTCGDEHHGASDIEPKYSGDGREEKRQKKFCSGIPTCSWQDP